MIEQEIITKESYFNCPEYLENHYSVKNIVNTFFISKLLDSVNRKISLITVLPFAYLENRGIIFLSLINDLAKLFTNAKDLTNALTLVITQTGKNVDLCYVKEEIKNILEDRQVVLNIKEIDILEFLISRKSNIIILKDKISKEIIDNNLLSINKSKFINKKSLKISIVKESEKHFLSIFDNVNTKLWKIFTQLYKDVESLYKELLSKNDFYQINLLININKSLLNLTENPDLEGKYDIILNQNFSQKLMKLIKNIKFNVTLIKFCKNYIVEDFKNRNVLESIQKSIKTTIDFISGNALNILTKDSLKDIDYFINNIKRKIVNQELYFYKKTP